MQLSARLRVLVVAASVVAASLGLWVLVRPPSMASSASSGAEGVEAAPQEIEVDVWVSRLREGEEDVEVRRRIESPDRVGVTRSEGVLHGFGPLLPTELEEMRVTLAQTEKGRAKRLLDAQASFEASGNVLKQIEFAKRLRDTEEASAAMSALEQGSYFLRERDNGVPTIDGIRYVGTSVVREGRELYVTVVIETKRFPRLESAIAYMAESERIARALAMEEFNGLPPIQRKALVQQWKAASEVARTSIPDLVKYFRPGLVISQQDTLIEN